MPLSPRTLRPANTFTPRSISGLALWLDAADSSSLYTTDAGPVTAVNDPRDISGCALWLDASDPSTITHTGGAVSEWRDKTVNARHHTASSTACPTTGTRTLNGLNVIDFDGANNLLTGNAASLAMFQNVPHAAVFMVMKFDALTANQYFFEHKSVGAAARFQIFAQPGGSMVVGGRRLNADSLVTVSSTATTSPCIIAGIADYINSDLFLRRDGATLASSTSFQTDGLTENSASPGHTLGGVGSLLLDGYIAEVIVYTSQLSTTDRARVEAYLAQRWGISGVHAPATATSDPVGYWRDRSGNGRHATQSTAPSRPLVGSVASGRGLVFDSNDSLLSLASIADIVGSPASSPATTIAFIALNSSGVAGFTVGSDNAANGRLLVSNSFDAAGGSFFDVAGASASGRLSYTLQASSQTAAGVYVVQRNGASMIVRRNGATIATKSDASQTFSATTARLSIGQAIGLTGFSGTCGSLLCYPSAISTAERQRLERYLAARWGITLAPQVSNADAQDWINRVYANGSTVSATTAAAVNTFCDAINNAGIRDRFYRLNLFCGGAGSSDTTRLNAALVPLYRNYRMSAGRNEIQGEVFSGWSVSSATVTGGAAPAPAAAPAGAPLASSFKEATTASAVPHTMSFQYTATGAECVVSAYVKPDGRDWVLFSVEDAGGNPFAYAYYNLAGMATGSAFSGATNSTITDAGNGWARISFRCTPTSGTRFVKMFSSTANNANVTVGDATKGFLIWGFQLEYGTTLTAYDSRPFGNTTDTNNGAFSSGDYREDAIGGPGGLKGNGSRWLDTGLAGNTFSAGDRHCSAYWTENATLTGNRVFIGNSDAASNAAWFDIHSRAPSVGSEAQITSNYPLTHTTANRWQLAQYVGADSAESYSDGADKKTRTTFPLGSPAASTTNWFVFGINPSLFGGVRTDARIAFYSIGLSIPENKILPFYQAVQAFQSALGRSV